MTAAPWQRYHSPFHNINARNAVSVVPNAAAKIAALDAAVPCGTHRAVDAVAKEKILVTGNQQRIKRPGYSAVREVGIGIHQTPIDNLLNGSRPHAVIVGPGIGGFVGLSIQPDRPRRAFPLSLRDRYIGLGRRIVRSTGQPNWNRRSALPLMYRDSHALCRKFP